jgi:hypothetical protein
MRPRHPPPPYTTCPTHDTSSAPSTTPTRRTTRPRHPAPPQHDARRIPGTYPRHRRVTIPIGTSPPSQRTHNASSAPTTTSPPSQRTADSSPYPLAPPHHHNGRITCRPRLPPPHHHLNRRRRVTIPAGTSSTSQQTHNALCAHTTTSPPSQRTQTRHHTHRHLNLCVTRLRHTPPHAVGLRHPTPLTDRGRAALCCPPIYIYIEYLFNVLHK